MIQQCIQRFQKFHSMHPKDIAQQYTVPCVEICEIAKHLEILLVIIIFTLFEMKGRVGAEEGNKCTMYNSNLHICKDATRGLVFLPMF